MNGIGGAATGDFTLASAHGHDGCIAGFIHVDLVIALAKDRESQVGRIDFESVIRIEAPNPNINDTFGDANLCGTVIQVQKGEAGVAGKANRCRSQVQFSASAVVGPQFVAGGHRTVDDGGDPVVSAGRFKGNIAVGV